MGWGSPIHQFTFFWGIPRSVPTQPKHLPNYHREGLITNSPKPSSLTFTKKVRITSVGSWVDKSVAL